MSWTKKTPKNKPHHKSPFTPKGFLSPKEPSRHELSQGTTLKSTGTLAVLFPLEVGQTQRAKSPIIWIAGWHLTWHWAQPPTHSLLHTTTLLLPCLLGWHPFSTSSKRVTGDNTTQRHDTVLAGHCRQLLFHKMFSRGGIQKALTGRFALSATSEGCWDHQKVKDKYFNLVLCLSVFFFPQLSRNRSFWCWKVYCPKNEEGKGMRSAQYLRAFNQLATECHLQGTGLQRGSSGSCSALGSPSVAAGLEDQVSLKS